MKGRESSFALPLANKSLYQSVQNANNSHITFVQVLYNPDKIWTGPA